MLARLRRNGQVNAATRAPFILAALLVACSAPPANTPITFTDADGGFSVAFPGEPKRTQRVPHGTIPVVEYQYQVADPAFARQVTVVEFQPGHGASDDGSALLNNLVTAYAKGSGAAEVSRAPVNLAGRKGIEAVLRDAAHDRDHVIDVVLGRRDRVYLLTFVGPSGTGEFAERFRDSFRLTVP